MLVGVTPSTRENKLFSSEMGIECVPFHHMRATAESGATTCLQEFSAILQDPSVCLFVCFLSPERLIN